MKRKRIDCCTLKLQLRHLKLSHAHLLNTEDLTPLALEEPASTIRVHLNGIEQMSVIKMSNDSVMRISEDSVMKMGECSKMSLVMVNEQYNVNNNRTLPCLCNCRRCGGRFR